MTETLEQRTVFTILIHKIRGRCAAQEFVDLARVPAVGDCFTTSEGLFQARLVVLLYNGDVAAEVYGSKIDLNDLFGGV